MPLYRPEAALYATVPEVARQMTLLSLGTFHERRGDQGLLRGTDVMASMQPRAFAPGGSDHTVWGRLYGQVLRQNWSGTISPSFDGVMGGFQIGSDLFRHETDWAHVSRWGVFAGHLQAQGTGRGFVLARPDARAGDLTVGATSVGGYWTHSAPAGWYVDAVVMGTFLDAHTHSNLGIGTDLNGGAVTTSIEAGYPVHVLPTVSLEFQGQLIWQRMWFDRGRDPFSTLAFNIDDTGVARLGLRLEHATMIAGVPVQANLLANLWHMFRGTDSTIFNNVFALQTPFGGTSLEVGGGVVARLGPSFAVYAKGSYTTGVNGDHQEAYKGVFGFRSTW